VVGFVTMIHTVQRFDCVRASAVNAALVRWAASLAVLTESLIGGPWVSFLRRCFKNFLPIFWWPIAIKINVVHWFGVDLLVVVVARSWSLIRL
jgi:hypothetical protein